MKAKDCSRASMLVSAIERSNEVANKAEQAEGGLGIMFGQFGFGAPGDKTGPTAFFDPQTTLMITQAINDICRRELERLGVTDI